ncbi:hypothetical protein IKX12_02445, partial [Candidatus Saccharibacteria bacterium]|nr:hypothetical protein [Candidatus Saccharibacteria bacterium]
MNKSASFSQDKAKYLGILSLKNIRRINDLAKIKVDKKYSEEKERIINVLHQYFEEISSIVNSDTWKDYYKYTAIGLDLGIQ